MSAIRCERERRADERCCRLVERGQRTLALERARRGRPDRTSARRRPAVRATFSVSDAVMTSALPATPAWNRSRACCDFLLGELQTLARGVDLLRAEDARSSSAPRTSASTCDAQIARPDLEVARHRRLLLRRGLRGGSRRRSAARAGRPSRTSAGSCDRCVRLCPSLAKTPTVGSRSLRIASACWLRRQLSAGRAPARSLRLCERRGERRALVRRSRRPASSRANRRARDCTSGKSERARRSRRVRSRSLRATMSCVRAPVSCECARVTSSATPVPARSWSCAIASRSAASVESAIARAVDARRRAARRDTRSPRRTPRPRRSFADVGARGLHRRPRRADATDRAADRTATGDSLRARVEHVDADRGSCPADRAAAADPARGKSSGKASRC